jgi:hypothetical protein
MKQVKINGILYVMDTEAYQITEDTDVDIIYVPEDSYLDYVALNSGLTLTKYNYNVIRVTKPEYDVPEPPTPTKETRLVIKYNIEYTEFPFPIYFVGNYDEETDEEDNRNFGINDFSAIEIDGVNVPVESIDENNGAYQFATSGEHIIKYTLKGNSIWEYRFFQQAYIPITSLYIPSTLTNIANTTFNPRFLNTIIIDEDNQKYTSNGTIGNCIVDKTTNILLLGGNNMVIPNGVVEIADEVGNLSTYSTINIPNTVTTIGGAFKQCRLTSITIPDSVISIGNGAFSSCSNLSNLTIGNNVTTIDDNAFESCSNLANVVIPDSVTTIGQNALSYCSNLKAITIGSGITNIKYGVLMSCNKLTNIVILATTPPALGSNALYGTNNCPIFVPANSVDTYKAASGWSTYASRIQAMPTE